MTMANQNPRPAGRSAYLHLLMYLSLAVVLGWHFTNLFQHLTVRFFEGHAIDSAGFVDLIGNITARQSMVSSIFSSFYSLHPTLTLDFGDFKEYAFRSQYSDVSFFRWHAYLISYPLGWLAALGISPLALAVFLNLLGTYGVVFPTAYFCYRKRINIFLCVALILSLLLLYPINDVVFGQFYFDKLFPFFMLMVCIQSTAIIEAERVSKLRWALFFLSIIITALISERAALMTGFFLIFFGATYKFEKKEKRRRLVLGCVGVLSVLWFVIYSKFFYDSMYASTLNFANIVHNADRLGSDEIFRNKTIVMLSVLGPFLVYGMLSPIAWMIAVFSIVPNILVDIGGAEKIGFATHYHMMYLPFLILPLLLAVEKTRHWSLQRRQTPGSFVPPIAALGLLPLLLFASAGKIDHVDMRLSYSFENVAPRAATILAPTETPRLRYNASRQSVEILKSQSGQMHVSASNLFMPLLTETSLKQVDAFPISIYEADMLYILTEQTRNDDHDTYLPVVNSYLPESTLEKRRWAQQYITENFDLVDDQPLNAFARMRLYKRRTF